MLDFLSLTRLTVEHQGSIIEKSSPLSTKNDTMNSQFGIRVSAKKFSGDSRSSKHF